MLPLQRKYIRECILSNSIENTGAILEYNQFNPKYIELKDRYLYRKPIDYTDPNVCKTKSGYEYKTRIKLSKEILTNLDKIAALTGSDYSGLLETDGSLLSLRKDFFNGATVRSKAIIDRSIMDIELYDFKLEGSTDDFEEDEEPINPIPTNNESSVPIWLKVYGNKHKILKAKIRGYEGILQPYDISNDHMSHNVIFAKNEKDIYNYFDFFKTFRCPSISGLCSTVNNFQHIHLYTIKLEE